MTPFIATDKRIKYIFSSPGNRRKKKKSAGLIGDCFTLGVLEKVWMIETKEKHKQNNRKKKKREGNCCFLLLLLSWAAHWKRRKPADNVALIKRTNAT